MASRELVVAVFAEGAQFREFMEQGGPAATKVFSYAVDDMAKKQIASTTAMQTKLRELRAEYIKTASTAKAGSAEFAAASMLLEKTNRKLGISTMTMTQSLDKISRGAMGLGKTLTTYVSLPMAAVAAYSAKLFIDFQRNMEMIHTQAGASQAEVTKQTPAVLNLAKTSSPMGPNQLSQGLYFLESRGLRGAKALNALKVSADAAGMGIASVEDVTNALGGAVVTGIKGFKTYDQAMGIVSATVGNGAMHMSDYAGALRTGVVPAAKAAGLTLQEVGAALDVLTDRGMPAQMAATRLRMTFAMMQKPTAAGAKALSELGISEYQLANDLKKPNGLVTALLTLQEAINKSKNKTVAYGELLQAFGKGRSSAGILTLLNSLTSSTSSLQGKLALIQQQQANFAKEVAAYHQTASYKISHAWASVQASLIQLGGQLAPALTAIAGKIDKLVKDFSNLPPSVKKTLGVAAIVAAAFGPLLLLFGGMIKTILQVGMIAKGLGGIFVKVFSTIDAAAATTIASETAVGTAATATAATVSESAATQVVAWESVGGAMVPIITEENAVGDAAIANAAKVDGLRASILALGAAPVIGALAVLAASIGAAFAAGVIDRNSYSNPNVKDVLGHPVNRDKKGNLTIGFGHDESITFDKSGKVIDNTQHGAIGGSETISWAKAAKKFGVTVKQLKAALQGAGNASIFGPNDPTGKFAASQISNSAVAPSQIVSLLMQAGLSQSAAQNLAVISSQAEDTTGIPSTLNNNPKTGDYSVGLFQENFLGFKPGQMGFQRMQKYAPMLGYKGPMSVPAFVSWLGQRPYAQAIVAADLYNSSGLNPWMGDKKKLPGLPWNGGTGGGDMSWQALLKKYGVNPNTDINPVDPEAAAKAKKRLAAAKKAGNAAAKAVIDPIEKMQKALDTQTKADKTAEPTGYKKIVSDIRDQVKTTAKSLATLRSKLKGANQFEQAKLNTEITKLTNEKTKEQAELTAELHAQAIAIAKAVTKGMVKQFTDYESKYSAVQALEQYQTIPGVKTNFVSILSTMINDEVTKVNSEITKISNRIKTASPAVKNQLRETLTKLQSEHNKLMGEVEQSFQDQVQAMQTAYDTAKSKFETAYQALTSEISSMFEEQTQNYINNTLGPEFSQNGLLTPAEQALKDFQDKQNSQQLQQSLADATTQMVQDISQGSDLTTIQRDSQSIQAAKDAITESQLQTAATQSRTSVDKQYADAVAAYTAQRTAEEHQLSLAMDDLETKIENGTASLDQLNTIMGTYGVTLSGAWEKLYMIDYPAAASAISGPGGLTDATLNLQNAFNALIDWVNSHVGTNIQTVTTAPPTTSNALDSAQTPAQVATALKGMLDAGDISKSYYNSLMEGQRYKFLALADGGVVTRPTLAMVGEGGEHEAVIPLSKLGNMGGEIHIHFDGPVIGSDLKKAARDLEPHIRAAIVRTQQRNATSGII